MADESGPGAEARPAAAKGDKVAALQALASRKRKEQEESAAAATAEAAARKKRTIDFGDSDEEEGGGAGGGPNGGDAEPGGTEAEAYEPLIALEEEDGPVEATDADLAFIDDEGVAPEARIDFGDDEEQLPAYEEAEEAAEDDIEQLLGKKKRRYDGDDPHTLAEIRARVDNLLAEMEVAVEEDMVNYEQGRPAIHKLQMLGRVEEALADKRLHTDLLDGGLLGVLKGWLEPMRDGTLPNTKVRNTILRLLGQLPVDCSFEDRKEQLKKSGLGKVVMFLYKLPDETPENRKLAKELVARWARPILAPRRSTDALDEQEAERILQARQAKQQQQRARQRTSAVDADEEEPGVRPLRPGDPGFRWHAAIPQAASLDYVRRPQAQFSMPERKAGAKGGEKEHRLTKKLAAISKAAKASGRAAQVSVEGRNVTIQH